MLTYAPSCAMPRCSPYARIQLSWCTALSGRSSRRHDLEGRLRGARWDSITRNCAPYEISNCVNSSIILRIARPNSSEISSGKQTGKLYKLLRPRSFSHRQIYCREMESAESCRAGAVHAGVIAALSTQKWFISLVCRQRMELQRKPWMPWQ